MAFDDLPLHRPTRTAVPPACARSVKLHGALADRRRGSRGGRLAARVVVVEPRAAAHRHSRARHDERSDPGRAAAETRSRWNCRRSPIPTKCCANWCGSSRATPLLARLLATRELVRNMTLAVVQIGDGRTPAASLATLRPRSGSRPARTARWSRRTIERWESAVRALQSIPATDAAQVYVNVKPCSTRPTANSATRRAISTSAVVKAIRMLNATPEVTGDLVLLTPRRLFRTRQILRSARCRPCRNN